VIESYWEECFENLSDHFAGSRHDTYKWQWNRQLWIHTVYCTFSKYIKNIKNWNWQWLEVIGVFVVVWLKSIFLAGTITWDDNWLVLVLGIGQYECFSFHSYCVKVYIKFRLNLYGSSYELGDHHSDEWILL
jgi:hypothetical protein